MRARGAKSREWNFRQTLVSQTREERLQESTLLGGLPHPVSPLLRASGQERSPVAVLGSSEGVAA